MRTNRLKLAVALSLVGLVACGDDGTRETMDSLTAGITPATFPDSETNPTSTSPPTSAPDSTSDATGNEGSATVVMSGTTTGEMTTSPLTSTDPSTSTTASTMTSQSTTDPSETAGSSTGGEESTAACTCTPGDIMGCDGQGDQQVCQDDCMTYAPEPCPNQGVCMGDTCVDLFCLPNAKECDTPDSYHQCKGDGSAYDPPVQCGANEGCVDGACVTLCLQAELEPSSVGCSFIAARMDNFYTDQADSLVIGNTSSKVASAQLYFTPNGSNVEGPQGGPVMVQPGQTTTFTLQNLPFDKVSGLRKGGGYRVQTTVPVVAYQHSPITAQATNDASMLFPEHALKQDYVIASYRDGLGSYPSYFYVIARDDGTTVQWTPPINTQAGGGVPAVNANQTGQVVMNRFDNLQVRAPNSQDLSGTIVHADKPIWVIGAVECVNVPSNVTFCDHVQEQMLALDYWGKSYVGAHSPRRGSEKHYWRVYGGEDGTTITTTPAQPGTPFMLNKGQWKELVIANNTSFVFDGDKPFLPVQYLEGQDGGAGTGDPAMYQMIPVEQFLSRYAFVTGTGYNQHYAQIIRVAGGADVLVDGAVVGGYYAVGAFEVADYAIAGGAHLAESSQPFGILNIGYTGVTSYAYPGGLKLAVINPQ